MRTPESSTVGRLQSRLQTRFEKMPSSLLFDPDEGVLVLVFILPLLCAVSEALPNIGELPYLLRRCAADIEAGDPATANNGMLAWVGSLWYRVLILFGLGDPAHLRQQELEEALSAVVMQRRWGHARMQAQVALRQRDREQNAKALLTAVHTLRSVAMAERGAHQEELDALQAAAVAASSEMQRERDERLQSARERAERNLEAALASERRRNEAERSEAAQGYERALEEAMTAHRRLAASELAQVEAEAALVRDEQQTKLSRAMSAAQMAEREARTLQQSAGQVAKGAENQIKAKESMWYQEREALQRRCEDATLRAEQLNAEVERLRALVSADERVSPQPASPPPRPSIRSPSSQPLAKPPTSQALAKPGSGAHFGATSSSPGGATTSNGPWSALAAALGHPSQPSVPEPPSSLALRSSPTNARDSTLQLWQACQQWRRVDSIDGVCLAGSKAAASAAAVLAKELTKLERSIEEEVCAWDYREFNYCHELPASEEPVTDAKGVAATVAGGASVGKALVRDAGHGGWTLEKFCQAPEAERANLSVAEVLALRLATGRLGGVLVQALQKGTEASLRPWSTTLACLVSAIVKLVNAQRQQKTAGVGGADEPGYLPVIERSRQLFDGSGEKAAGVVSRGFLSLTSDPWVAREAAGGKGRRAIVMLRGAISGSADVGWVSQFPQQCERLLPPGSLLVPVAGAAASSGRPDISATNGVRCVEASLGPYTQPQPYSTGYLPKPPTDELATGISVPGNDTCVRWALGAFRLSEDDLFKRTELDLPQGLQLDDASARLLGLLCGRVSREVCPFLEELSIRGGALTPSALRMLVEGLRGGHESVSGEEGLTLDMHGALSAALTARPSDAAPVGEAIAKLLLHAPNVAELDVGACALGSAGIAPIALALSDNHTLNHLGIANVGLGPSLDGAKKLASALRKNGDLLSLDIRHNGLTTEGVRLVRSAAASRPFSQHGTREQLDLRYEPQTPLPLGALIERSPRDDQGDEYDDDVDDGGLGA